MSAEAIDADAADSGSKGVAGRSGLVNFLFLKSTLAILLTMLMLVGGVIAYGQLVKEALPDLDIPRGTIQTQWPGADPQTVEQQVTQPIEDELAALAGLKILNSASFDSFSLISVEFDADVNSQDAMMRLRAAVDTAAAELPGEAEKPSVKQTSVDDRPILTVALSGNADRAVLSAVAKRLETRLETVAGVNEIELDGVRDEIVQIELLPHRLLALQLSPTKVRDAIRAANLDQPFGEIESDEVAAVVRMEGQFRTVEDLASLPILRPQADQGMAPIVLGDVATVSRQLATEQSRALYSGGGAKFVPAVTVSITKVPGADTITVVDAVKRELEAMSQAGDWPEGLALHVTQDEGASIWDSLTGVFNSGWQAMLAVFVILFLVLGWREGLIAGLAVPVTFAGAMLTIFVLGFTLNELVIIGMVLALGLLVDVFILMMEGMHEEMHANGKGFDEAALATIGNYAVPALAGQLTTILALTPLMAIGGVSGKFIQVLPISAIACLALAYLVALFICIPLSRTLLERAKPAGDGQPASRADRLSRQASDWLGAFLDRDVLRSRKRARLWVGGAAAAFLVSLVAFSQGTMELYPATDGEKLGIDIELPADARLKDSAAVASDLGDLLREKPYFESVIQLVGSKSPFATAGGAASLQPSEARNFLGFSAIFVDRGERDGDSFEIAEELREEIRTLLDKNVVGATLLVVPQKSGPATGEPIEIRLNGNDFTTLQRMSGEVQHVLQGIAGTVDVRDNLGNVISEVRMQPRREAVEYFGLSLADFSSQLRIAFSNDEVGTFPLDGPEDDLKIHLGTAWPGQEDAVDGGPQRLEDLALIRAFAPDGESIAVTSLVQPVQSEAPLSVSHTDGVRALTVMAGNLDRSIDDILADARPELERLQQSWPDGYTYTITGESEEAAETYGSAAVALAIAVVLVFAVLVLVFDSFPQAFILLTTMPLALVGSFLFFWLFGLPFSFFAMVGVIALIGVVANNGIVMVDTMNRWVRDGLTPQEAASRGATDRLRPIITTSITTVVGLIPLALGSPMYEPLCLAIIFGLVSSTVLSLVVVPALYLLLSREEHTGEPQT